MFKFYQWLQTKLPAPISEWIMIVIYSGLIFLMLTLANTDSPTFIYWDQ
jgi:hypothetical protein